MIPKIEKHIEFTAVIPDIDVHVSARGRAPTSYKEIQYGSVWPFVLQIQGENFDMKAYTEEPHHQTVWGLDDITTPALNTFLENYVEVYGQEAANNLVRVIESIHVRFSFQPLAKAV